MTTKGPRPFLQLRRAGTIHIVAILLILIPFGATPDAAAPRQEPTTRVDGRQFSLRAKATRAMFFGTLDLYSVGIYTSEPIRGVNELRNSDMPKALRVGVLYDGGMPEKIPSIGGRS
ncbi:hypothetical protein BH20GEM3_BH20GEM3_10610 [soil metagenome]